MLDIGLGSASAHCVLPLFPNPASFEAVEWWNGSGPGNQELGFRAAPLEALSRWASLPHKAYYSVISLVIRKPSLNREMCLHV